MATKKVNIENWIGKNCAVKCKNGMVFEGTLKSEKGKYSVITRNGMRVSLIVGDVKEITEPTKPEHHKKEKVAVAV